MWRAAEKFSPRDVECESTKAERSGMSFYGVAHAFVAQSPGGGLARPSSTSHGSACADLGADDLGGRSSHTDARCSILSSAVQQRVV